jgi:hypothetical protein
VEVTTYPQSHLRGKGYIIFDEVAFSA